MHLQCPSCEYDLNDDTCCLIRQPQGDDDAILAEFFEGYRVDLWQCPNCRQHIIIVENTNLRPLKTQVFYAEFKVPGASGSLPQHPVVRGGL
jgi:hypothetical protein